LKEFSHLLVKKSYHVCQSSARNAYSVAFFQRKEDVRDQLSTLGVYQGMTRSHHEFQSLPCIQRTINQPHESVDEASYPQSFGEKRKNAPL
jgi:hypothetical protein